MTWPQAFPRGSQIVLGLLFAGMTLGSSRAAWAQAYPFYYRMARPMGMGGAFTAVADDENALFYNPAGLARIPKTGFGIVLPSLDASESTLNMADDASDTDMDDPGEVADLLRKYTGEHQHASAVLFPHLQFRTDKAGIMVAVAAQGSLDMDVYDPVWPEAHVLGMQDIAVFVGSGGDLLAPDGASIGGTLKYVARNSLDETYTPAMIADKDLEDRLDDDFVSGSGVAADLGAIYALPLATAFKTRFGLAALNVPQIDAGDAKDLETLVNAGVSVEGRVKSATMTGALDFRDLAATVSDDVPKRIHVGGEVRWTHFAFQAGLNQGYLAAGAAVNVWALKLALSTYGEEAGESAGQLEDRRYVAQFSLDW